ncbi:glutamate--tRNA ligase [Parvularcula flava]|uniref:Glutamate--tRNA ligase n=1 Tax=Aquisalinus luteolus TaxID=1566827 RepID=A0A8J3ERS4_9PROT|nr:glutamate--tRNA ligase [Aquisalinus luteolus]NHK28998.1 glutamate--tRNA ligase [Aquisalinus luteolus]GGI00621.1 glutamate--tRNA ligase [Aquisalinus luteolus]
MSVKVRFAPSPTGKIHVGNVRAALLNYLFARKEGGTFMLRSDDTDQARSTKVFEEGIQADLGWLGLKHDEFARQSERFGEYDKVTDWLKDKGFLYPCYETSDELDRKRKLQRARGLPPVYDRAALKLSDDEKAAFEAEGRKPHWRFKLSQTPVQWNDLIRGEVTVDTSAVSDPILIREDGMYLYTLPSCIDDVDFGITHVIRGEDHVTNTATQVEIFRVLIELRGEGQVPQFAHHSLLVGADGQGLSKRLGSLSIEGMREAGIEPAAITSLLARLGTSDPVQPVPDLADLVEGFSFDKMGRAPARFDMDELTALNAKILHETPFEKVADRLSADGVTEEIWNTVRGNVETLKDAVAWKAVIDGPVEPVIADEDREFTTSAAAHVPDGSLTDESWGELTSALKEATGRKGKGLFMPLRLALTGQPHGPDMAVMFRLIGAEKARARLLGETA